MEILDIYDKYRNLTGKKILKENYNSLNNDEFTIFSYAVIFNQENEMLIQKRNSELNKYPNFWDLSVNGNVYSGETTFETIERILFEEYGYEHNFLDERPYLTINSDKKFCDVYIINNNIDINILKLDYKKIQNVTWATKDEILQLIDEARFVPYERSFIELLFFNKDTRGVIIGEK